MGVGVYSNNFDETGGTFLVDGPDCSDEAYQASIEDMDEDDQPSLEGWASDQGSDHFELMNDAITEALESVGMEIGANSKRDFQHDFLVHTRDKGFVIGTRGWEHDSVVGVWQDEEYGEYQGHVNGDVVEMALRDGVMPERMCARRRKIADDLLELIRLHMQSYGLECSFKTSGYTSQRYPVLDEAAWTQRCEELVASIRADLAWVSRPYEQALREEGAENFKGIIKLVVTEEPSWYRDTVNVAFMAKDRDGTVGGRVGEDLRVEYTNEGALHLSALGLKPEFAEGQSVLPLPETPEVMAACIEYHLKRLESNSRAGKSIPQHFLLPPSAAKEVLDLGANDEIVFDAFDDEEPEVPEGPGMM